MLINVNDVIMIPKFYGTLNLPESRILGRF